MSAFKKFGQSGGSLFQVLGDEGDLSQAHGCLLSRFDFEMPVTRGIERGFAVPGPGRGGQDRNLP